MPTHIVAAACRESTKRKKKGRPTLGQPLGQAIQCFRVALAVRGLLLHLPWVFLEETTQNSLEHFGSTVKLVDAISA